MNINETVIISANHRHRWISQIPNMNKIPTIYHTLETVELKLEQSILFGSFSETTSYCWCIRLDRYIK